MQNDTKSTGLVGVKPDGVAEPDGGSGFSVRNLCVQAVEGATHNEQDVPGV